jgi:septal ring factor EnvC (AmiA/AmiB activator)
MVFPGFSMLRTLAVILTIVGIVPAAAQAAKPLSADELKAVKEVGVLIGRDESPEKVDAAWRAALDKSKDLNVDAAVKAAAQEARAEAERNVQAARKKAKALQMLKGEVKDELAKTRSLLAESRKRKGPKMIINRKTFELAQMEPPRVTVKPGEVLTSQAQVADYVKELQDRSKAVEDDIALARTEHHNALQKQQKVIGQLSATSKRMHDTARSVMRRLGW